ncbi:DNA-methyltransferase [Clostridium taeniosporum]|uniref:Methyltransferase n=1 Tax=Clostridium taeniosporum TaxID=394958 RepID=A0A1D7XKR2_9CLOT|nr:site-specific DNA-methyltransferase [Clostridium taeniosporum]AOR23760.1 site-specific DNA-methyltransferase [Clostridium taeniosporum]
MENLINKIINIDCLEGLNKIQENSIDLVVTSPPYNLNILYDEYNDNKTIKEYIEFISKVSNELFRVIKGNGRVCINIPCDGKMNLNNIEKVKCDISYMIKDIFYKTGFKYRDKIYWDKQNFRSRTAWGSYESASNPNILLPFEEIIVLYKGTKKKEKINGNLNELIDKEFQEISNGHWIIKGVKAKKDNCPVPFPQEIPSRLIKLFSYRGDIILDPFCGSGTSCMVAKKLGRKYIGFELSKKYTEQANKRINQL